MARERDWGRDRYRSSAVDYLPPTCHPERQRRILVHGVSETDTGKYQSAGGSPEEIVNE